MSVPNHSSEKKRSMTIQHLISPATLPSPFSCNISPSLSLSVMSYNVLLPNSVDGWWNYKMYQQPKGPSLDNDYISRISSWEYRQVLLKKKIETINADVVCLQEVSEKSFEQDFAFMKTELGYHGCEIFKRGRFRPATFWKTDKCRLMEPAVHKDRTLLTVFEILPNKDQNEENKKENDEYSPVDTQYWHVLNCHLQAGIQGKRRLRQIEDGVKASCKVATQLHMLSNKTKKTNKGKTKKDNATSKNQQTTDPSPHLIVCGDFNGDETSAAVRYLEDGSITPDFMEDGMSASSKTRTLPTLIPHPHKMLDISTSVSRSTKHDDTPPPTMVVTELISLMVQSENEEQEKKEKTKSNDSTLPKLSTIVIERLERIYYQFATGSVSDCEEKVMTVHDVEKWLIIINKKVGRGSEFRTAATEMGWISPSESDNKDKSKTNNTDEQVAKKEERPPIVLPADGILTLSSFIHVYEKELQAGKFWGIAHDLAVLGEALPFVGLYSARFDRMYYTSNLLPYVVIDTLADQPCPNDIEPSDHLPVAASFTLK